MGNSGESSSDEEGVTITDFMPPGSIYSKDAEDQLKMARTLLESTPSVKVVVEVPKYAHKLLSEFHESRLAEFYNLALRSAIQHWADFEYDTTSPERLEIYRALDRLATARSILSWVRFGWKLQDDLLQELETLERR